MELPILKAIAENRKTISPEEIDKMTLPSSGTSLRNCKMFLK
jgi:hypothetical protein